MVSTPESRRQHLRWRQAAIYSLVVGALIVVAAVAVGMWTGDLAPMFTEEFKKKPSESPRVDPVPCPVGVDPTYPEPSAVTVRVLNGTKVQGLAGTTASALATQGFPGPTTDNAGLYDGVAKLVAGTAGVNNAYTLAVFFPDDVVITVDRREDASVDVTLGSKFKALLAEEEVAFAADAVIEPLKYCQDAEAIVAKLAPASPSVPAAPEGGEAPVDPGGGDQAPADDSQAAAAALPAGRSR
ncbi:MAG: LytR C-terminal domain-containing protein [Bifidobacteriaceae bacterium]|jgi:hypothetical protein|nr:LytR C-terminal domain-containing protein [Bifidobacteriaceae bacterium]